MFSKETEIAPRIPRNKRCKRTINWKLSQSNDRLLRDLLQYLRKSYEKLHKRAEYISDKGIDPCNHTCIIDSV